MRNVKISELKNDLDKYLSAAEQGEEFVIRRRNKPIAMIVPYDDEEAETQALVAAGKIRPPKLDKIPDSFWKMPGPRVSLEKAIAAVSAERDED